MINQLVFDAGCQLCQSAEFKLYAELFKLRGGLLCSEDDFNASKAFSIVSADETLFLSGDVSKLIQASHKGMILAEICRPHGGSKPNHTDSELRSDYKVDDVNDLAKLLDKDYINNKHPMVLATVGGIVQSQSTHRLLLVQTRKWSNKWGTPGGKIDYGETMEVAYYREIFEETGVRLDNAQLILIQDCIEHEQFIYPRHFLLMNYYSTVEQEPQLISNYESQSIGWYALEDALSMDLNRPTQILLDSLIKQQIILNWK